MSNSCLVTKFKGNIDASIPKFNTLVFGITSVDEISTLYLATGDEPVHIKAYVECHSGSISGSVITETDFVANRNTALVIPKNVEVTKAIEISGPGIYKLRNLVSIGKNNVIGNPESSIKSMMFANNLICFGGAFAPIDEIPSSVKYFVQTVDYQQLPPSVEILNGLKPSTKAVRLEDVKYNTSLKGAYYNYFLGNLVDLPVNMELIVAGSNNLIGSVEDLITSFRLRGRQSGYIALSYGKYSTGITYNGRSISSYADEGLLPHFTIGYGNVVIFGWDVNSLTVADSIPEELNRYTSISNPYDYLQQYNS